MIYLKNTQTTVKIPKQINSIFTDYKLRIVNNLTNKEVILDVVDKSTANLFYTFDVDLILQTGEYKYEVLYDGEIKTNGLMIVGDYSKDKTQYQTDNTIKTYER